MSMVLYIKANAKPEGTSIAVEKLDRTGVDVEALVANGIKEAQEKAKNF